jgi:uncharacterized protein (TIGR03435 family)
MRPPILVLTCLNLCRMCAYGQAADAPSFEVASVKPASPSATAISCSGGPGTTSPGIWRCSNVPLAFLISRSYGFQAYQFTPRAPCCQGRFDFTAKVPVGATKEQFQRMIQKLLEERLKLKLHHEQKEMAIYELTVGEKGPKVKESAPDASSEPEDPWAPPEYSMGKDGYPVFPAGRGGLAGPNGHYRWTGFNLSMQEIVKTLSFHLGRPGSRRHPAQGEIRHRYEVGHRCGLAPGNGGPARPDRRVTRHRTHRPDPHPRRPGSTGPQAEFKERSRRLCGCRPRGEGPHRKLASMRPLDPQVLLLKTGWERYVGLPKVARRPHGRNTRIADMWQVNR